MRIATLTGVLMLLAGCNALPPESVNGDDQNLSSGSAGKGTGDAEKSDKAANGTTAADATGVSDCELKAKACYADNQDPAVCDAILKGCVPPETKPTCGQDCDASVRACFAKGIDAKTCDAQYHACLGSAPPGSGTAAPGDPTADCELAAKQCFADGSTPAEKCQALLDSCTPPPANDPNTDCVLAAKQCFADGSTPAEKCQALLDSCMPPPADTAAKDANEECLIAAKQCFADGSTPTEKCQAQLDSCNQPPATDTPGVDCKLEYVKCLDANPDAGICEVMLVSCANAADGKAP
jgi:hypothetical protein